MIDLQTAEWPLYVLSDLMGYGGDWSHISKMTKIPLLVYLPISIAASVGLSQYTEPFRQKALEKYEPEKNLPGSSLNNFARPGITLARWRLKW